ncbi:F0F1 ATP synthase subunit alpha [Candidatus Babeliales bacterium]|nr:F0F1 ATP synthase subunit alpha [Candidatus Babeliales bacterium]MBY0354019.1 F0F1 ATP synthase subunit alpha [Candidatus Babeliales bacterium]
MVERDTDIISILEKSLSDKPQEKLEEIGTVIKVGDGICKVYGLTNAIFGEFINFENGGKGIILDLDEDYVSVVLLDSSCIVIEQEVAHRTGTVFCVPVGEALVGRVVNARGMPLDACGEIKAEKLMPVEHAVAGIAQRSPVNRSMETGIVVADSLIPIGRGQRELIIGNRGTGKTTIAIDTILHQKGKNVICIYVSIGNKQSSTAKIIYEFEKHGAFEYCIVVNADAKESALNQFLAPYSGCTIGEYFMKKGKDVLIVYDDLSAHAIAYRELSLLLRRPPGREAYPGDIFYIHSRLLERAGQLSAEQGGGSLTALPIIQTQGDDISAYIPTNLISITDGQIFLDTSLFNSGMRPAVNVGLSVSRVGGSAQTKAIKKVAGTLKLDLAQYNELLAFAQFGSELDRASRRVLDRGRRATELLKQDEHVTYSFVDQVLFLFLLKEGFLDKLTIEYVKPFAAQFVSYVHGTNQALYMHIQTTKELSDDDAAELRKAAEEFGLIFSE